MDDYAEEARQAAKTIVSNDEITEKRDSQIAELEKQLEYERDARKEERFIGIVFLVLFLDIVFFMVIPSSGGALALVFLELLILIPLARRMGLQEMAHILSRVLDRMARKTENS